MQKTREITKNNSIFNTKAMDALNPMMKFGQEEEDMHSSRILPPYADAVFLYDEDDAMELENTPDEFGCVTATNSDVKKETKEAYENVGASMRNMYDNEMLSFLPHFTTHTFYSQLILYRKFVV